jgi:hypothetical protein
MVVRTEFISMLECNFNVNFGSGTLGCNSDINMGLAAVVTLGRGTGVMRSMQCNVESVC